MHDKIRNLWKKLERTYEEYPKSIKFKGGGGVDFVGERGKPIRFCDLVCIWPEEPGDSGGDDSFDSQGVGEHPGAEDVHPGDGGVDH